MSSRFEAIATYYALEADELLRAVRRALTGPDAMIEDACSFAWCQLLSNDQVELDNHAFGWLYCVAIREGYRLADKARRAPPMGVRSDLVVDAIQGSDPAEASSRRVTHMQRAALVRQIAPRKRQLVLLQAAGFTYVEISQITGDSIRTIDRQLRRARRTIRALLKLADA